MADKKITQLNNITGANLVDADEFVVVDVSADETKAITLGELKEAFDAGSGFVRVTGDTMTGDLNFGDNDKALFGAGSDLQIYANGGYSYIDEVGANNLNIRTNGANIGIFDTANSRYMALFATGGAASLYHNGSKKIETTSTGVDITGTLTSDGLTVDGGANSELRIDTDAAGYLQLGQFTNGAFIGTSSTNATYGKLRLGAGTKRFVDVDTSGDISFYEDTGTTPKFFWDASAESLGIGTSSPKTDLDLSSSTGPQITLTRSDTLNNLGDTLGRLNFYNSDASGDGANNAAIIEAVAASSTGAHANLLFRTKSTGTDGSDAAEAMRIDSSGNVGIGTSSPSYPLDIAGTIAQQEGSVRNTLSSTGTGFEITANAAAANVSRSIVFKSSASGGAVSEKMRIDSSGNLLVGKTSADNTTAGTTIYSTSGFSSTRANNNVAILNRLNNDGDIMQFRKDGTTVGSIGSAGGDAYYAGSVRGVRFDSTQVIPCNEAGAPRDADTNLGATDSRFKDLYLSGGVYLGGTGAANNLDDYEEGTWTPVMGTVTHTNSGKYAKIGSLVFLSLGDRSADAIADGGSMTITGLPFTVAGWEWTGTLAATWADASNSYQYRVATGRHTPDNSLIVFNRGGAATTTSDPWNISVVYRTNA